jgi:hypothetical protein
MAWLLDLVALSVLNGLLDRRDDVVQFLRHLSKVGGLLTELSKDLVHTENVSSGYWCLYVICLAIQVLESSCRNVVTIQTRSLTTRPTQGEERALFLGALRSWHRLIGVVEEVFLVHFLHCSFASSRLLYVTI